MNNSLFQITQEFLELASMIEDAGGEVNDSILEELAISRENFAHKAQGYTSLILKWESEIEAAAAETAAILLKLLYTTVFAGGRDFNLKQVHGVTTAIIVWIYFHNTLHY